MTEFTSITEEPEFLSPDIHFPWYEYIVFVLVLCASLGIGVFYGFFGKKNKTNEEFLMAGRSMSILPVTLSLVCSFVSAITLLGNPVEIYFYGAQYTFIALAFIPMTLVLMFILVPVFFRLQLTSAYEYFEWRFSRRVRVILSAFAIFHLCFYMPTTVYGPSLALDQEVAVQFEPFNSRLIIRKFNKIDISAVAGINTIVSCAAIFGVCIAYSSLGGLKAVLWTDALQALVMVTSLAVIIVVGVQEIGGTAFIWEQAVKTQRTEFLILDIDLRTRHTFWTATVGGFFMWLPLFASTQAQIQRYNSVPTLRQSRLCLLFNMCGLILIIVLCSWIGLMLFAKYYDCDPVQANIIKSPDQLLPLFVMEVLGSYHGIPGLLVAGLTCGSLSTVSSALNSLTAIITEDFVKHHKPGLSEERLAVISKAISTVSGIIAFVLVFIIAEVNKTIQISPFSTLLHGSLLGPILGAFCLGMFFPWTNELGTLLALIVSVLLSAFVGLGNIFAGRAGSLPDQKLTVRTDGCEIVNQTERFFNDLGISAISVTRSIGDWKDDHADDSFFLKLWSISYLWQPALGVLSTFLLGMLFSAVIVLIRRNQGPKVNESLMSTPFVKIWKKLFGKEYIDKWIDFESPPYSGDPIKRERRRNKNNAQTKPKSLEKHVEMSKF